MHATARVEDGVESRDPAELELTLLMPCLDEAETVEICIRKGLAAMAELGIAGEVLVADNGSTDGSQELARAAGARVVDVEQRGYGSALRGGIEAARGRFVIMGDADDSYDWSDIGKFVERLRGGSELVMGCRMPAGGGTIEPGAMPPLHRWLGNPVLSWIGRVLFGAKVTDFNCGLRGFDRDRLLSVGLRTTGMEFAIEVVVKATIFGLRVEEVPITLHRDGRSKAPHLNTWRDGWRDLRFMLLHSPRWVLLYPGALMWLLGVAGFGLILPGPFIVGGVAFDTNTLVVASLLTLMGAQWLAFGLFAREFATTHRLLPPDPWLERWSRRLGLERGVVLGTGLLVAGLGLIGYALWRWSLLDFGAFPRAEGLRIVLPAATLMALGLQTVLASFFLSMLALPMGES